MSKYVVKVVFLRIRTKVCDQSSVLQLECSFAVGNMNFDRTNYANNTRYENTLVDYDKNILI